MRSIVKYAAWTAGGLVIAGAIFALSERQFLTRYLTRADDPLVMPVSWFQPADPVKGERRDDLPVASEAMRTIPEDVLSDIATYAEAQNSQGLIVVHNGAIQLESYWDGADRDTLFNPQSMSKTVLAMLLGIAVEDGHIESLDDPVGKYIREWASKPQGTATIRQALWMAAGLEQMSNSYEIRLFSRGVWYNFGDDFEGMILDLKQVDPPGTKFEYNNEENNVLGMVIERATGQRYADYLSEKLWQPLGLADASMFLDREGGSVMKSCCIFSRPYDWAKLGVLLMNRGASNGEQIVPAEWIDAMVEPSPLVDFYGYQVWLGSSYIQPGDQGSGEDGADEEVAPDVYATDDMVIFLGYGGQKVWVSPSNDLVIVRATMKWADSWVETKIPNAVLNALANPMPVSDVNEQR